MASSGKSSVLNSLSNLEGFSKQLPSNALLQLNAELSKRSLRRFIENAWPIVEPGSPFVCGWHIDCVCEHLEAVTGGRLRNLLIAMPPRHAKSTVVSVMWTAWEWISRPSTKWLFGSYAASLATRDSVRCRRLIESSWYQSLWCASYQLEDDENKQARYANDRGGFRISLGVGGAATGEGADRLVVDDPMNVKEAESDTVRNGVTDWFDQVMVTRLNDPKTSTKVIVAQRAHEADLIGHLIEQGGYELLELPAEWDGAPRRTVIGWSDPRNEMGELLWPARYGRPEIETMKRAVGSYGFAAQYQQRPSPAGGGTLRTHWWRYFRPDGMQLPAVPVSMPDGRRAMVEAIPMPLKFDEMLQSWDCAFKDVATSDYVVGMVVGRAGSNRYILDIVRDRMDLPKTLEAVRKLSAKWPQARTRIVEDKANGSAVISMLKNEITGLIAVNPEGGKESRAAAVSPEVEAGNWYVPHPSLHPWVEGFLAECSAFPRGKHDDQVDAFTQAANRLMNRSYHGLLEYYRREYAEAQPAVQVDPDACPGCDARCIVHVGGNGWQCNQCGNRFRVAAAAEIPAARPAPMPWPKR